MTRTRYPMAVTTADAFAVLARVDYQLFHIVLNDALPSQDLRERLPEIRNAIRDMMQELELYQPGLIDMLNQGQIDGA